MYKIIKPSEKNFSPKIFGWVSIMRFWGPCRKVCTKRPKTICSRSENCKKKRNIWKKLIFSQNFPLDTLNSLLNILRKYSIRSPRKISKRNFFLLKFYLLSRRMQFCLACFGNFAASLKLFRWKIEKKKILKLYLFEKKFFFQLFIRARRRQFWQPCRKASPKVRKILEIVKN